MSDKKIKVNGILVRLSKVKDENYVSLTDIATKYGKPNVLISNWLRNRNTLEYLGLWEQLENDKFNSLEFERIKNQSGLNRFYICLLYTSPSPRDATLSRMPSSA